MQVEEVKTVRYTLAVVWLVTGVISLVIYPVQDSLSLLAKVGIYGGFAVVTLYVEALLDILIGILTLSAPCRRLWLVQFLIIGAYSLVIVVYLPEF